MITLTRWYKTWVRPDGREPVQVQIYGDLSQIAEVLGQQAAKNRSGRSHDLGGLIEARVVVQKTKRSRRSA